MKYARETVKNIVVRHLLPICRRMALRRNPNWYCNLNVETKAPFIFNTVNVMEWHYGKYVHIRTSLEYSIHVVRTSACLILLLQSFGCHSHHTK